MERRDQSIGHKLRMEIIEYGSLKKAWGLGHIQCKFGDCSTYCPKRFRPGHDKNCPKIFMLIGHYRDFYERTKHNVYLGASYENAHSRLNHVKSFL